MTNTILFRKMVNDYNALAYTHKYIFGYTHKGIVYAVHTDSEVLPYVCTLDRASRGAGYSLRFKPNKAQKETLASLQPAVLCSAEYFNAELSATKYNAGELFEKLVTESYGQTWVKDNVPFTAGGDIEVDGVAYQIKYEKATFTNEKTLARLKAAR